MASTGLDDSSDPFFQIGDDVTAASFPDNGRGIFEIGANTTINDAFHALVKENVLSAPVYDAKNNKYLGFLDVSDILALAYGMFSLISLIHILIQSFYPFILSFSHAFSIWSPIMN